MKDDVSTTFHIFIGRATDFVRLACADEGVVTSPGVVSRTFFNHHLTHIHTSFAQLRFHVFWRGSDHKQWLVSGDGTGDVQETFLGSIQIRSPVSVGMRPSQLYEPLRFPFGWKHICIYFFVFLKKRRILSLSVSRRTARWGSSVPLGNFLRSAE